MAGDARFSLTSNMRFMIHSVLDGDDYYDADDDVVVDQVTRGIQFTDDDDDDDAQSC